VILRILLFGVMALGLCGFGAVAWRATHLPPPPPPTVAAAEQKPPPPPPVMIAVLTTAHGLRAGTVLKPEDVTATPVAELSVRPGAERDTPNTRASLNGALLRHSLSAGQTIIAADVLLPGERGFLAAMLAPGMRAVAIGIGQIVSDAGLVAPGDRLDLILTDADEQADAKLKPGRSIFAETILSDLRVLAVDQQLIQVATVDPDKRLGVSSITVEVSPMGAERLALALRLGKVALAIRAVESSRPEGGLVLAAAGDTPPAPPRAIRAGDVLHSINAATDGHGAITTVHVFDGQGAGQEFKF
jgi:pilus assembly protein CpaB